MTKLKYLIEAALMQFLFTLFKILPLDMASFVGGFIARTLGPLLPLPAHRIAKQNLAMVFPELTAKERDKILTGMWDNLGRVAAELPHLPGDKLVKRITTNGGENMPTEGHQVFFFSGHLGNWELLPSVALSYHVPVALAYKLAKNPYTDKIIATLRTRHTTSMFAKGPTGGIKLARAIKGGQSLAMLVDQKMNEGIPVPFFGRDAMTAPAIAQLALRYNKPIVPTRVRRMGGCHFIADIYPPLQFTKTGDDEKDTAGIMKTINGYLEQWIREHPDQWFWVHQRWPKDGY